MMIFCRVYENVGCCCCVGFRSRGLSIDPASPVPSLSRIGRYSLVDRPEAARPLRTLDVRLQFRCKRIPTNWKVVSNFRLNLVKSIFYILRLDTHLFARSDNLFEVITCWKSLDSCQSFSSVALLNSYVNQTLWILITCGNREWVWRKRREKLVKIQIAWPRKLSHHAKNAKKKRILAGSSRNIESTVGIMERSR